MPLHRRHALATLGLAALAARSPALAQPRLRVAGVYTVPVTQPWVGRIDSALKVAAARGDIDYTVVDNVPAADYERALRQQVAGGVSSSGKVGLVAGFALREAALAMVDRGADVLYAERPGVAEAAQERRVLAIGNVVDLQAQFPDTVVASALWNMQPTIDEVVGVVAAGTLFARDYARFSSLRLKGSSLSPLGTLEGRVPAAVMERVKARTAGIVSGAFVVRVDPTTPRSSTP